jgi:hypothetical protein
LGRCAIFTEALTFFTITTALLEVGLLLETGKLRQEGGQERGGGGGGVAAR